LHSKEIEMRVLDRLYHYKFRVDRVIDGDTIEGKLDKGRKNYDEDVRIRLLNIDAPEKRGETRAAGEAAKDFLEMLILGKEVVVHTLKDDDDDSFGRMLGEVYLPREKEDIYINQFMIDCGHAVPYKK
jgi:micrococcal nuclease